MEVGERKLEPRLADLSSLEVLGEGELCVDGFCAVPTPETSAGQPSKQTDTEKANEESTK